MMARLRSERGLTLIELLVASTMSVVIVGAAGSMLISTVKDQPQLSKRAQTISTARFVLERMTREIRNGVTVDQATATKVSFRTYVRHTTCGGTTLLASGTPAIKCEVTYSCTTTSCSRIEANEGIYTGTEVLIFSGLGNANVFCYVPSSNTDPSICGPAKSGTPATYIGLTLHLPNPSGSSDLTISDGASLRNATLLK
jgi:type II secretory pathway pseudopilin PulG